MNKKLFSWKALAGLALLVAMGMTSCKNTTEVDPNDPYNTTKPAKPSSKIDGDFDWEVSITKTSDLAAQWKSVKADVVKALAEEDVANIKINCGNYALDNGELAIPDPFNGKAAGKTINLVFSGSFKSKTVNDVEQALNVTLGNLAGADVNIFLPGDEFKMVLDAKGTKTAMYADSLGATTLKTLYAKADAVKKNALTIDDEVIVSGISMDGALIGSADNILAKLISGAETLEKGKGALVGNKDNGAVYVKNLILTGNASVKGADETALEVVTIPENVTLTLDSKKSEIESIIGLGTAKKPSTVAFAGDKDDFSKIGSFANVTLTGTTATNIEDFDIFENVIFGIPVNLYTNADNTEFLKDVNVLFGDDVDEIAFSNVNFGSTIDLTLGGAKKTTTKPKTVAMYQWDKTAKNYVEIDDESEVFDTNTDYVEIVQAVSTSVPTGLTMKGGKFVYAKYDAAVEALDDALEAYEDKIEEVGQRAANGKIGAESDELKAYIKAYKAVYGDIDTYYLYATNDDGKYVDADGKVLASQTDETKMIPVKVSPKALDEEDQTDTGLVGTKEYKFMTAVNAKIGDADWFEICYAKEKTVVPSDVTVSFDEDCTIGDGAITLKKLNKIIAVDGTYASPKDIPFTVVNDDETYQWTGDSKDGYFLK